MILNISGGGDMVQGVFGIIHARYPSGSVCTCSNGVKTYTARDRSGIALFPVYEAGTWIVYSTDGTFSHQVPVSITEKHQVEKVAILYTLHLYEPGNEHSEVHGGWSVGGYRVAKDSTQTYIGTKSSGDISEDMFTATLRCGGFDITNYSTLYYKAMTGSFLGANVVLTKGGSTLKSASTNVSAPTGTFDVSDITGICQFGLNINAALNAGCVGRIFYAYLQ